MLYKYNNIYFITLNISFIKILQIYPLHFHTLNMSDFKAIIFKFPTRYEAQN